MQDIKPIEKPVAKSVKLDDAALITTPTVASPNDTNTNPAGDENKTANTKINKSPQYKDVRFNSTAC